MTGPVRLSALYTFFTMFPSLYHHEIVKSYNHWQKWWPCKRLRTDVKTNFATIWVFPERNSSSIHRWRRNNVQSLRLCRRGALLFSVKFQGNTWQKIVDFYPSSGLLLQFKFNDDYEMMHKDWRCIEEVPYSFSRSSIKFQGHTLQKFYDFYQNWAFLDCNSRLDALMAMRSKWCIKLVAT